MTTTDRTVLSLLFLPTLILASLAADDNMVVPVPAKQSPAAADAVRAQDIDVVSSGASGVVISYAPDAPVLVARPDGVVPTVPGADRTGQPGEPDLPARVVLVGLPQTGRVLLSTAVEGTQEQDGVAVSPVRAFEERAIERSPVYAQDRLYPQAPAEILEILTIRNVRVARLKLSPVQYNPVTGTLKSHRRVVATLSFEKPGTDAFQKDPLNPTISRMLLNGREAVGWKLARASADSINFFSRSGDWCRVAIETTGLYRIDPKGLKDAGFDPGAIDPATLRLFSLGPHTVNGPYPDTMIEVPLYASDDGNGRFDSKDFIAFYAEAPSHWEARDSSWYQDVFNSRSVFWLTWGGDPGARMATLSGSGAVDPVDFSSYTQHIEYDSLCPARSGLLWLWKMFFKSEGPTPESGIVAFRLQNRDTLHEVSGRMYGRYTGEGTSAIFKAAVILNGVELDTVQMTARATRPPAADFLFTNLPPEAAAHEADTDTLGVRLVTEQQEEVYLDFLDIRYRRRLQVSSSKPHLEFTFSDTGAVDFSVEGLGANDLLLDVTDPWRPVRIVDAEVADGRLKARATVNGFARFAAALSSKLARPAALERRTPGRLRQQAGEVDYCIVCPDEFLPAATVHARYREQHLPGMPNARSWAARLSEIYDDYAFGYEEPGAIKKFLGAKMPAYAMLAGDGTYDYKNVLGLRAGPVLPPIEFGADVDPEVYGNVAWALDAWYADADGDGGGPDMILGRATCRSGAELRQFTEKVRRYESQAPGIWAKRFLLSADDEYKGSPDKPDDIRLDQHIGPNEDLARQTTPLLDPVKVYLTEYGFDGNVKPAATTELLRQLDRGVLLWSFFGHGAGFQLCHEELLHINKTVAKAGGGTRNALAFFGSCGVGRFDDTRYEAISEELVRMDGGCIATVGATKATSPPTNAAIGRRMFLDIAANPDSTLGPAFFAGYMTSSPVSHRYHLFGDPATQLRVPIAGPEVDVRPDTLYPGGRNRYTCTDSGTGSGYFEVSARELDWQRNYRSDAASASYVLPGYEICHAVGTMNSGVSSGSFVVPKIPYPDTTIVPNGSYVRIPGTGRVSLLNWEGGAGRSHLRNTLDLSKDTVPSADVQPPSVELFAGSTPLPPNETTRVPSQFELVGMLEDESGILLVPSLDGGLSLSLKGGSRTSLSSFFAYDKGSATEGRFTYDVSLDSVLSGGTRDSVVAVSVIASDNIVEPIEQHRRTVTTTVMVSRSGRLGLDSCLVVPNPVAGSAWFTYVLLKPAMVSVRIFTTSGRLIRSIRPQPGDFGFNRVAWDGLDSDGAQLANGVYLYKLDARPFEGTLGQSTAESVRDKFLIHR